MTVDYPDLTVPSAGTPDILLPRARADMAAVLEHSRRTPIAAAPHNAGNEPADAALVAARSMVPDCPLAPVHVVAPDRLPHRMGVIDLLTAYADGSLTPTRVLAALERRWTDPALAGRAVLARIDGARTAAADSEARWKAGTARPLEGIPFAVKDIIDVAGAPVTAGSHVVGERTATEDATAVARLRAAGAIPVLMVATTEFACGAPHNRRHGTVVNPWDRTRWTGGSSTGSAAALAAGLVPLALGTDTGGSIRVPSAMCNLTGLKPTQGLVPRTGVASLSWTLDHIGPMARCAADLRPVLAVLAGPDDSDPSAAPEDRADAVRAQLATAPQDGPPDLSGLRLGVPTAWFTDLCDHAVRAARDTALAAMRDLGARAVPMEFPDITAIHDAFTIVLTCELASNQEAATPMFDLFDIGTQIRIARGTVPTAVDYLRALRQRAGARRAVLAAFDAAGVDLVLTPGVGATAPWLDDLTVEVDGTRYPMQAIVGRNTALFDYLGLPAVMAPAGFSAGLPIGVQLTGRPWADDLCLRAVTALQAVTDHHRRCAHD